ncbi:hypothetical protein E2C01_005038 [Portunus trituberculatus]|uniref:Uncharacterized protein n=1 Tax=Portunus trituberculatus TaxID=210409 RepID=A0A5B7CSA4_PORTR|nr:hypothetical protein [Portunus trituberculatus]
MGYLQHFRSECLLCSTLAKREQKAVLHNLPLLFQQKMSSKHDLRFPPHISYMSVSNQDVNVNDASSQELVALCTVRQRQRKEGTLCVAFCELKLADVRVDSHVTKRASQDHEVHHHGAAWLALYNELRRNNHVDNHEGNSLIKTPLRY